MGLDPFYTTLFMHLREGEQILKIYRHHPTPFVKLMIIAILGLSPFYLILFLLRESFSTKIFLITSIVFFVIFAIVVAYMALIYWLDKFIVTNHRILFVNWKSLTRRDEAEAFYHEIQEIQTQEKGFLSYFRAFDYGTITVETASAHVIIEFTEAPDPEGIRRYIHHVRAP
jgi:uncharacterized membrane protein YdbT with pleckstrin-like domain